MDVIVVNKSKGKVFRSTRRIIGALLVPITKRVHIGSMPRRALKVMLRNLRAESRRGINIKVLYSSKAGYHGFKGIELGGGESFFVMFKASKTKVDNDLL